MAEDTKKELELPTEGAQDEKRIEFYSFVEDHSSVILTRSSWKLICDLHMAVKGVDTHGYTDRYVSRAGARDRDRRRRHDIISQSIKVARNWIKILQPDPNLDQYNAVGTDKDMNRSDLCYPIRNL